MGSDGMATNVATLIGQILWLKGIYDGVTQCLQQNRREAVQRVLPQHHLVLHDVKGYAGSTYVPNPEGRPLPSQNLCNAVGHSLRQGTWLGVLDVPPKPSRNRDCIY